MPSRYARIFLLALSALAATTATAGFNGAYEFTQEEKDAHVQALPQMMASATSCLREKLNRQRTYHYTYGISAFYGTQSEIAKIVDKEARIEAIKVELRKKDVPEEIAYEIEPTSCVELVMGCMKEAFALTNQNTAWDKINAFVQANKVDGGALQDALRGLGWRILYWNPNTSKAEKWDEAEKKFDPENKFRFWGYHQHRLNILKRPTQKYYRNPVDDVTSLVDFGKDVPEKFLQIPFAVGTAHTGFHVFAVMHGEVIEGHASRPLDDKATVEGGPFNPIKKKGHPNAGDYGMYGSGLMAVPPGYMMPDTPRDEWNTSTSTTSSLPDFGITFSDDEPVEEKPSLKKKVLDFLF